MICPVCGGEEFYEGEGVTYPGAKISCKTCLYGFSDYKMSLVELKKTFAKFKMLKYVSESDNYIDHVGYRYFFTVSNTEGKYLCDACAAQCVCFGNPSFGDLCGSHGFCSQRVRLRRQNEVF